MLVDRPADPAVGAPKVTESRQFSDTRYTSSSSTALGVWVTAARMKAFVQLPGDQQERITKTRQAAYNVDRGVLEEDQRMVDELLPTIPEARNYPTAAR